MLSVLSRAENMCTYLDSLFQKPVDNPSALQNDKTSVKHTSSDQLQ